MSTAQPPERGSRNSFPLDELWPSVPVDPAEFTESLAALFSRTLYNASHVSYMLPSHPARGAVIPWFFRSVAIPACRFHGEIYTTPSIGAAALWIRSNDPTGLDRILREAVRKMPFKLGWAEIKRWAVMSARLETVHRWLLRTSHWHLLALSAEPSIDRKSIREWLIEPVLSQAESDDVPCYVDTFDETQLGFYEACGFRVAGAGRIPGGPMFWSMLKV